jgi:hypothetical protein
MCDAFLQNYASFVDETNNEPNITFFLGTHCTGSYQPRRDRGLSPVGNVVSLSLSVLGPRSVFVPFNIGRVRFLSSTEPRFADFQGPALISDLNTTFWPGTLAPMIDIVRFQILEQRSWNDVLVPDMCMGRVYSLGAATLTRFKPAHKMCDEFMENQFCVADKLAQDPRCSCYNDLGSVKEESKAMGVALPVTCFGRACATTRSYKSATMLQKPCQLTVCRQLVREEGLISGVRSRIVTCAGKFFEHQARLESETVESRVQVPPIVNLSSVTPASAWLVLGVAAVLLIVLVFLMFYRSDANPK